MTSFDKMDRHLVNDMYKNYAILFFLDVPVGTHFGIDMNSWDVGPKFKGVKLIPPGVHYIYFSAVSKEGDTAPRTGFFYNFKPKEIFIKKWNAVNEEMEPEVVTEEETTKFRENLQNLDQFLGPYPYESYKKWVSLTECISPKLLSRLEPEKKFICSVAELIPQTFICSTAMKRKSESREENVSKCLRSDEDMDKSKESEPKDGQAAVDMVKSKENEPKAGQAAADILPNLNCKPGTQIRFTAIPTERYPSGSSPSQVTKYGMDSSFILNSLLQKFDSCKDLLGELQLAFICFLVGNVYEAFEQWKKLVRLLCTCDEAIESYPELYKHYLTCLYYEIEEVPRDFFVDIVSSDNFLTNTLQIFFETIKLSQTGGDLKIRARKFQEHVTKRFKWNFDEEPEDCAPVIIENVFT